MTLSKVILIACLKVLQGLLWLVTLLIVILIARNTLAGAPSGVHTMQLFWLAVAAAIGGWSSGFAAARLRRDF